MTRIPQLQDYLTILGLALYYLLIGRNIKPFHRQFNINNPAISHPYGSEQIPNTLLVVLVVLCPTILVIAVALIQTRSQSSSTQKEHVQKVVVAFLVALAINSVVIDFLKKTIGNHRPDFLARCVPQLPQDSSPDTVVNGLMSIHQCTAPFGLDVLYEGIKSTPSGHSSLSFGGMVFVTLFLWSSFSLDEMWKKLVSFVPVVVAAYIAISRTQDYRHHYFDVVFGGFIGTFIAFKTFFHYFPEKQTDTLKSPLSSVPGSPLTGPLAV